MKRNVWQKPEINVASEVNDVNVERCVRILTRVQHQHAKG